jgi:tRNA (guanine-N7-)-methyltransferase
MSLNKLEKFEALKSMPNVYENFSFHKPELVQNDKVVSKIGLWKNDVFQNQNAIVMELACGKGEYSVAMAKMYPNKNFIGVDIKGNRIHHGAKIALDQELKNIVFVRTRIELLHHFFAKNEIDEVWITFPDPFPSFSDRGNRLVSPKFLDYYRSHFSEKPMIYHLKTDNFPLFRYAVGVIDGRGFQVEQCTENIYGIDKKIEDILRIETYYEKLHKSKGSQIHYVRWKM